MTENKAGRRRSGVWADSGKIPQLVWLARNRCVAERSAQSLQVIGSLSSEPKRANQDFNLGYRR
jgi:hypothetical protein